MVDTGDSLNTAPSRPVRRKELRPAEIIEAASAEFAERGFAAARVSEIARRAGAAKGTVYRYFETKEALFEAVVGQLVEPVFEGMGQTMAEFDGPASLLLSRIVEKMYAEIVGRARRREILRLLIAEGDRFPQLTAFYHRKVIASMRRLLTSVIELGVRQGEFRDSALALQHPELVAAPAILAAIWKLIFEDVSPLDAQTYCRAHIDLVLHGLKARPE